MAMASRYARFVKSSTDHPQQTGLFGVCPDASRPTKCQKRKRFSRRPLMANRPDHGKTGLTDVAKAHSFAVTGP